MKGLSPLERLNSGYSYVQDKAGHHIGSVGQVKEGQELVLIMKDGRIHAMVTGREGFLEKKEKIC